MHTVGLKKSALAALILATGLSTSAKATEINAVTDGRWYQFDVDQEFAGNTNWVDGITDEEGLYQGDYSDLSFTFTLNNSGVLKIADGGIAGDNFIVLVNGQMYNTSLVAESSVYVSTDFDAALADNDHFSSLVLNLAPGSYIVTGLIGAYPIGSTPITVGGLSVSEVPLPAGAWLFGSALMACAARTRRRA